MPGPGEAQTRETMVPEWIYEARQEIHTARETSDTARQELTDKEGAYIASLQKALVGTYINFISGEAFVPSDSDFSPDWPRDLEGKQVEILTVELGQKWLKQEDEPYVTALTGDERNGGFACFWLHDVEWSPIPEASNTTDPQM